MGAEAFIAAQIVDFAEATDDRVASLLVAGSGISLAYNDGAGTLTIASTVSPTWGSIGGTLSSQTDLQTALNGKAATTHTHVIANTTGLQAALDAKLNLSGGTLTGSLAGVSISLVAATDTPLSVTSSSTNVTTFGVINSSSGIGWAFQVGGSSPGTGAPAGSFTFRQTVNDINTGIIASDGRWLIGAGTPIASTQLAIVSRAAGNTVGVFRGAASQTANLTEWQNSSATVLASVSASGVITASGNVAAGATSTLGFTGRSVISSPQDNIIQISNAAQNSFGMLRLGGGTSGFPAIQRNGAAINFRTADDGNFCNIAALGITASGKIVASQNNQTDYLVQVTNNTTSGTFPIRNGLLIETTGTGGASSSSQLLRINSYGTTVLAVTPGATTLNTNLDGIINLTSVRHLITNNAPSIPSLIVRSGTTPTANVQEWQDSSNVVRASITPTFGINAVAGTFSGLVAVGTYTVATLPSAAANAGALAQVTDSSVTANGSAVAGGGSNRVVVFSNGSTWDVVVA